MGGEWVPGGRVIGLDRDPKMLALATEAIGSAGLSQSVTLVQSPFSQMRSVLEDLEIKAVNAVVLDLGLSSDQLAWEDRGFSFLSDGPLDMRFNANEARSTAAELVNQMREAELANLFFEFGEERFSRRIARRLVEERKKDAIRTTSQLAEIVRRAIPAHARAGPINPATRVFQALRIAVNDEMGELETAPGGNSRAARPGWPGGDHQLSFAGRPPRQVGVQDPPGAQGPYQETRHGDGAGSGVKPTIA